MAAGRRSKFLIAGLGLLGSVVLLFEGELAILLANRRPDVEAARLVEALELRDGDTVAEIGAGAGRLTVALAQALPASRVYSTELSSERLADIREAVRDSELRNVEVREAALADTNLPDGCCDAIFMRTVYHHFTSPETIVAALRQDLKPGGRLGIIDFEPRGLWKWLAVPDDTPNRGGHGVPIDMLTREVTGGGAFVHDRTVSRWAGRLYFVRFTRR